MEPKRLTQPTTDRISGLPLEIIHDHILTSLPLKHVQTMCSLSKTWYHVTTSFPYLVFDDHSYYKDVNKYLKYVTKTLQGFHRRNDANIKLQKLTIPMNTFKSEVAPVLDSWIQLALRRGVEEFNLKIGDPEKASTRPYNLPRALFAPNSSIKVAKFEGYCSFPKDAIFPRPNTTLMKLCLDSVLLDEKTLSFIISTCPLIEELTISSCLGVDCVRICNLHKLKILRIIGERKGNNYTIDINAPSLQTLEITGPVKELDLQDLMSRLPLLRSLSLTSKVLMTTKLKVSSNTLNKLKVFGCHEFLEFEIDAPNLISVVYDGNILPLSSFTHYGKCRWNISTICNKRAEDFLVELSNFGSKVNRIEYLSLSLREDLRPFNFEELKDRVLQPIANINHLEACLMCKPNTDIPDLLDGVLWSCHPRTLSFTLGYSYISDYQRDYDCYKTDNSNIMKHILKIIGRHRHCCSCTLARSWLHHLEEVKYVTRDGREGQLPIVESSIPNLCEKIKFNFKW